MVISYSVPQCWYEGAYEDRTAPCKAGRPFSINHEIKPDRCVLIIHGYTGYPGEMVRPATDLYDAGFDVYVLRLPGHGTSGSDFSRTSEKDWLRVAENAARDLMSKYRTVYMAGHSMGGAITVLTAEKLGIERIALMAPAVFPDAVPLRLRLVSLIMRRKQIAWQNDPGYVMYYEDAPADDMYLGREYWSYLYFRQLKSLFSLMHKAMESAGALKSAVLVVTAGKDALVKREWTDEFYSALKSEKKHVVAENCTHYLAYDKDKNAEDEAIKAVVSWLDI